MKKQMLATHVIVIAIAVIFIVAALGIESISQLTLTSYGAYPILIAGLSLIFAILIIIDDRAKQKKAEKAEKQNINTETSDEDSDKKVLDPDVLIIMAFMLLYGILLYFIGYILATLIFTIASISYLHNKDYKSGMLVGFISTFIIVLIFKYGFSVILP